MRLDEYRGKKAWITTNMGMDTRNDSETNSDIHTRLVFRNQKSHCEKDRILLGRHPEIIVKKCNDRCSPSQGDTSKSASSLPPLALSFVNLITVVQFHADHGAWHFGLCLQPKRTMHEEHHRGSWPAANSRQASNIAGNLNLATEQKK